MKANLFLSKSQYLRGVQCRKSLYLHKNHKELRDETSAAQESIFASGTDVGILAQSLFPGGIEIPYEGLTIPEQVEQTAQEIAKGTKTIYEASFSHDGVFVKVDILHREDAGWALYEIKSATDVKEVNYHDVALQSYVLAGAGIELAKTCLVHVDNQYVRHGDIDVNALFKAVDVTSELPAYLMKVEKNLAEMRTVLGSGLPSIDIGPHCHDPYECDFQGHCWKHVPEDSVFSLRGRGVDKFDYYRRGLIRFGELPLDELNASQRFQVEMHLRQGEQFDPPGLAEFLKELWYPICYFDFETFTSPVPLYEKIRPYQQVPFQYSLHVRERGSQLLSLSLREPSAELKHFEFLAEANEDPRIPLIRSMISQIPKNACVLTYNMAFEKSRLSELMEDFPEYADDLAVIRENVRDLIVPFRKRFAYRWQQRGSNSIKDVLPAFVPELSYKDLEISDGGLAMNAYHQMCATKDPAELQKLRTNLLKYCCRDTEAMVRLHEFLEDVVLDELTKSHQ